MHSWRLPGSASEPFVQAFPAQDALPWLVPTCMHTCMHRLNPFILGKVVPDQISQRRGSRHPKPHRAGLGRHISRPLACSAQRAGTQGSCGDQAEMLQYITEQCSSKTCCACFQHNLHTAAVAACAAGLYAQCLHAASSDAQGTYSDALAGTALTFMVPCRVPAACITCLVHMHQTPALRLSCGITCGLPLPDASTLAMHVACPRACSPMVSWAWLDLSPSALPAQHRTAQQTQCWLGSVLPIGEGPFERP
jgi:hypothetical protein